MTVFGATGVLIAALWAVLAGWAHFERSEAVESNSHTLAQLSSALAEHVRGLIKLAEIVLNAGNQQLNIGVLDTAATTRLASLAEDLRGKSGGLFDLLLIRDDGTIEFLPPRPNLPPCPRRTATILMRSGPVATRGCSSANRFSGEGPRNGCCR